MEGIMQVGILIFLMSDNKQLYIIPYQNNLIFFFYFNSTN